LVCRESRRRIVMRYSAVVVPAECHRRVTMSFWEWEVVFVSQYSPALVAQRIIDGGRRRHVRAEACFRHVADEAPSEPEGRGFIGYWTLNYTTT